MKEKTKITIRQPKPRNRFAQLARLKKGGVHQTRRSRNVEKQAWEKDWSEDIALQPITQNNVNK